MDQATICNKQNDSVSVYRYRRKWSELHYIARSRRHAGICRQAKSATIEAFYVKEYSGLVVLNIISDSRRIGWARLSGYCTCEEPEDAERGQQAMAHVSLASAGS
jgi:hypothetical protein